MKQMKKYISFILFLCSFASILVSTSCTSDIDLDIKSEPVGILNILADPDSLIYIQISHSWPLTQRPKDVIVKDASVTLSVNGLDVGPVRYDADKKLYVCNFTPKEGDKIEAKAETEAYGTLSGRTTVPEKTHVEKWSYESKIMTDYNSMFANDNGSITYGKIFVCEYRITFSDPAEGTQYYMIRSDNDSGPLDKFFSIDPILNDGISPFDAIFSDRHDLMIFSDRQINGKDYTISYQTQRSLSLISFGQQLVDRISLYTISEDYYLYLRSLCVKYGSGLNEILEPIGLSEPRAIYSNINGGSGIIASRNGFHIENNVAEEYEKALHDAWVSN